MKSQKEKRQMALRKFVLDMREQGEKLVPEDERRFIELGRLGANTNVRHPDRKEWESLRIKILGAMR
jgi:hypothetical protein